MNSPKTKRTLAQQVNFTAKNKTFELFFRCRQGESQLVRPGWNGWNGTRLLVVVRSIPSRLYPF